MKKNVGNADRVVRALIALLFAVLYITGVVSGLPGIILLAVGVILIVTALFSFCPIYLPFRLSTRKKEQKG